MRFNPIGSLFVYSAFVTVMTVGLVAAPAVAPSAPTNDWGKADASGVQIRFHAEKSVWQNTETPSLKLDLRNTGSKTALYFGLGQECLIEVDGHWYAWSEPIPINMPARQLFPGKEKDGAVTVELTAGWFTRSDVPDWDGVQAGDARGVKYLKLSPGKHTVRVKFRPSAPDTTITATSNPVEIVKAN